MTSASDIPIWSFQNSVIGDREEGGLQGCVREEEARVQGLGSRVPTFFLSSWK
jgi:hypothetical protein